jgi:hypothetical protein
MTDLPGEIQEQINEMAFLLLGFSAEDRQAIVREAVREMRAQAPHSDDPMPSPQELLAFLRLAERRRREFENTEGQG